MDSTLIEQIVYTHSEEVKVRAVGKRAARTAITRSRRMFKVDITGLDKLQRHLTDASEAFKSLDGEISTVKFNPHDPSSVEAAVVQMEQAIDAKIAPYRGNAIVENVATQMKDRYRQELYDRAAKARLQAEAP